MVTLYYPDTNNRKQLLDDYIEGYIIANFLSKNIICFFINDFNDKKYSYLYMDIKVEI